MNRTFLRIMLIGLVAAGCGPATPQQTTETSSGPPVRKQMVGAMFSEPAGLHQELTNPRGASGSLPGLPELFAMLDGGVSYLDEQNVRYPWLTDAVPTIENGLWTVAPDGRMETTWRIKAGTKWHDGVPV